MEKLEDLPPPLLKETKHFFSIYKDLEEKKIGIDGWAGRDQVIAINNRARERYRQK